MMKATLPGEGSRAIWNFSIKSWPGQVHVCYVRMSRGRERGPNDI